MFDKRKGMEAASTEELTSQIERHIIAKEKRNDRLQVCESIRHVGVKCKWQGQY